MVTLLERAVELHPSDHAAQRRLRELRNCHLEVARAVGGELGVGDLEVEDAVDLQLRIVLGDADLRRHVERNFAQVVLVRDAIDERDHEIEAGLQHGVEAPESLDDERMLLRHHANRLRNHDERDDEQRDGEQRRADHGKGLHYRFSHGLRSDSTRTLARVATMYIVSARAVSDVASSASQSEPR